MYQTDKCVVAQVLKVVVIINLIIIDHSRMTQAFIDRVSVPSHIAVDIFDGICNGEGQSSQVLVFCVNFERHICAHITTSIKCYLVSLRSVYVPFTYILCQSNWHVYISTNFQNVNKPSTLHSYLQNKFLASKSSLI